MTPFSAMTAMITFILLCAVYIGIIQATNTIIRHNSYSARNILPIDLVIILMYIMVCCVVGLLYVYADYDSFIIYYALAVFVMAIIIMFVLYCVRHKRTMQKKYVVFFFAYFAIVLYLTLFVRVGTTDTTIKTAAFDDLKNALETGDASLAEHMVLNIIMFIPFGYLIPAMNPKHLRKWSFSMLGGLVVSTCIETLQMVCQLGQADIDDIIANALGAVIGYGLVHFVWQVNKNWRF